MHGYYLIRCLGWKEKYSCFRKCSWREKSSPGQLQIYVFYRFKWIFFKNFTLKELLWRTLFFIGKQEVLPFIAGREKKSQFLRINLLAENCLNSDRPNFFHYRFKIQSLTWTWHRRSQNLQPTSTSKTLWWIWLLKRKYVCSGMKEKL